jgi:hypothetical protein
MAVADTRATLELSDVAMTPSGDSMVMAGPLDAAPEELSGSGLPTANRVIHWETHRGKNNEFDKTEAGTGSILLRNRDGLFDPLKTSGVYVGTGNLLPLRQVRITMNTPQHPTVYNDIFTGYVENWGFERMGPRGATATLDIMDGFELLEQSQIYVTKNNTSGGHTFGALHVDDRINMALEFAKWPPQRTSIFPGNVVCRKVTYNPGDSMLQVIQDAADAEMPALANFYMDKSGNACFRGRYFRLDPFNSTWDGYLNARKAKLFKFGDDKAIELYSDNEEDYPDVGHLMPMSNLKWELTKEHIYTVVTVTWADADPKNIYAQTVSDSVQAKKFGRRDLTIQGLVVLTGDAGGGQTAAQECKRFGLWYLENYKKAFVRATQLEVHSKFETTNIWSFLTQVEIGDLVELYTKNPGGGGFFGQQYYVDGIHNVVDAKGHWPEWVATYDLSPVGHWKQDDWPGWFPDPF